MIINVVFEEWKSKADMVGLSDSMPLSVGRRASCEEGTPGETILAPLCLLLSKEKVRRFISHERFSSHFW